MLHSVISIIENITKETETDTGRGLVLIDHTIIAEKKSDATVSMEANYKALEPVREIVIAMVERSTNEYQPLEEGRKQGSDNARSKSSADSKPASDKGNIRRGFKKGGKKN